MDEYYCPNCGAILNEQDGFDLSYGTWTCNECGMLLMDDDVYEGDTYLGIAWFCDECGALLNRQSGFSDSYDSWNCKECGHTNRITADDIKDNSSKHSEGIISRFIYSANVLQRLFRRGGKIRGFSHRPHSVKRHSLRR